MSAPRGRLEKGGGKDVARCYQAGSGLLPPLPPEGEHRRQMLLDQVIKEMLDPSCSDEETGKDMFELMQAFGALEPRPLKGDEGCLVMAPAKGGARREVDLQATLISGDSLVDGNRHTGRMVAVPQAQAPGLDDLGSLGEGTVQGEEFDRCKQSNPIPRAGAQ